MVTLCQASNGTLHTSRFPRAGRPPRQVMLVERAVSSMNTNRLGSSLRWLRRHRRRMAAVRAILFGPRVRFKVWGPRKVIPSSWMLPPVKFWENEGTAHVIECAYTQPATDTAAMAANPALRNAENIVTSLGLLVLLSDGVRGVSSRRIYGLSSNQGLHTDSARLQRGGISQRWNSCGLLIDYSHDAAEACYAGPLKL
jgi:hypothetical protein